MGVFTDLLARRQRMATALSAVSGMKRDVRRIAAEGQEAAVGMAMWAAVMMVTDILKIGLSFDRRASLLFTAFDAAVSRADRLMQLFGARPMAKKTDLMAQVDPSLRSAASVVGQLREVRGAINKAAGQLKVPTGRGTAYQQWDTVARIGIEMADDAILILEAGKQQQAVARHATAAEAQVDKVLRKLSAQLAAIDAALVQLLADAEIRARTA